MHTIIRLTFIALFFLPIAATAQRSDFISLQKNDRTIKSYFKGSFFEFIHQSGSGVSGYIDRIYKDTLYMYAYDIRMTPTYWGTRVTDTIGRINLKFGLNEIAAIPKPQKGFEFVRNGTLFMIGGVGYAFLHTFNGLIQKSKINPSTLAISGGVAAVGFTMRKLRKYYYPIGKKYKISYVQLNTE
ncbi:MAG: hypothetical protein IT249_11635 [Chitinophagaceae bacterium]|nr:hypothetical protein [Chitinophagaceae bacterium]